MTMKPGSQANAAKALADIPPLRRDIRLPGTWRYLINYVLLGSSAVTILIEMIESGVWRRLWAPLVFIGIAIINLAALQAAERKPAEPGTAPNGDPATRPGNSETSAGPPSVS